ncbi:hypothetical protein SAMN04487983_102445 [Streptomyces sp. yr375]|uniref:hypothetical protein n=1 Tax=Streptomyces sp. yr375 TaxID=1761906 RepID=UPI0008B53746|nr:hypothetical protein [Streptomyces sp. yr375]SER88038.1 hypothetical protein SAMN04487983_102445 [Streptomyces sp. yr375]
MGRILKRVPRIPWGTLEDSLGSARDIPSLLSRVAWGDEATVSLAIDELGDRVCSLGFVVSEATPHVVPFLVELAGDGTVRGRAEILELVSKIYSAREWESTARLAPGKDAEGYREKIAWEAASQGAVLAGAGVFQGLLDDPDPEVSKAARDLIAFLA